MEKDFPKEPQEEGYNSPDSRANFSAISKQEIDKESISGALDSSGSKPLSEDDDNEAEADSNEIDQVEVNTEATESKNIGGQEEGKEGSSKFKCIVSQRNGHWGARLYYDRTRIWLGTFKTSEEAVKAYHRAYLKFRGKNGEINFPISEVEKQFQDSLTPNKVKHLIRDHNYDRELQNWCTTHYRPNQVVSGNQDMSNAGKKGKNIVPGGPRIRQHLFRKQMTASDVGKFSRLVIPKQYAELHFPKDKLDAQSETFLTFVDTSNSREWQFRFSFWKSCQVYVLTREWRRFVKDKDLKGGDTVSFSRDCKMPSSKFYITVHVSQNLMSNNCADDQSGSHELLQEEGINATYPKELEKTQEKIKVEQNTEHIHGPPHQKTRSPLDGSAQHGKRKAMEDECENESGDVIKLSGIEISRKEKKLKDGVEIDPKAKKGLERLQIDPKAKKQKDGEVEIESKARKLFGNGIPKAKRTKRWEISLSV